MEQRSPLCSDLLTGKPRSAAAAAGGAAGGGRLGGSQPRELEPEPEEPVPPEAVAVTHQKRVQTHQQVGALVVSLSHGCAPAST